MRIFTMPESSVQVSDKLLYNCGRNRLYTIFGGTEGQGDARMDKSET